MRRNALLLVALVVLLAGIGAAPASATNELVSAEGHQWNRTRIAVKPNADTVTWTSQVMDGERHNVHLEDESLVYPGTPQLANWTSPARKFTDADPGKHPFYCEEHGARGGLGMAGVVYVNSLAKLPANVLFSANPNSAGTGQPVTFDATATSAGDGAITKLEWDFGDGASETVTDSRRTTSHTYTSAGSVNVQLKVTDANNLSDVKTVPLQVNAPVTILPPTIAPSSLGTPSLTGPAAVADKTSPAVTDYGMSNKAFQAAKAPTPTSGTAAKAKGTTFKYTLSEAATVKIELQQLLPGRKKGKACVKPTAKLSKAKKCVRAASQGTLTRTSHAGANAVAFSGRVGSRALKPGSYQAVLTATDAARNVSARKTLAFKVVR